jgi:hypothetical protein
MDFESYRIVTRVRREVRALVFTQPSGRFAVREPLGPYAVRVSTVDSMVKLESWIRKRGWRLEKVRHFS